VVAWADNAGRFSYHRSQVDIEGEFTVSSLPQRRPVMIQAGDSDSGRDSPRTTQTASSPARHARSGSELVRRRQGRPTRYGRAPDGRQTFVGSPATVADALDAHVQGEACDGFILIPHITPGGLDRLANEVVPRLQERGSFRTDYEGATLRDHLGIRADRPSSGVASVRQTARAGGD
jgi:hypothetical protein